MTDTRLLSFLEEGNRLPQPAACAPAVYERIAECWHQDPSQRPVWVLACHQFQIIGFKSFAVLTQQIEKQIARPSSYENICMVSDILMHTITHCSAL